MTKRKIIEIERDKCNGCGLCTTACAEGALALDDENKAVVVRELYCDGMGACLDVCPTGALRIVERESEAYDSRAAFAHVLKTRGVEAAGRVHGARGLTAESPAQGRPGSAAFEIPLNGEDPGLLEPAAPAKSTLSQWPVQLHLVSPLAPYFLGADLLVAADCTAFALGSFHQDILKGKKLAIACPKLDNTEGYVEKLAEIVRHNRLKSLTVAIMTVPCCSGLLQMVRRAVEASGVPMEIRKVVVGIDGRIL